MLESFTRETCAERLHETFRLRFDPQTCLELELIEVEAMGSEGGKSKGREPFCLLFRGPEEPSLPQRIYHLENDTAGSWDIFLVPVGPDEKAGGLLYEAVFT